MLYLRSFYYEGVEMAEDPEIKSMGEIAAALEGLDVEGVLRAQGLGDQFDLVPFQAEPAPDHGLGALAAEAKRFQRDRR